MGELLLLLLLLLHDFAHFGLDLDHVCDSCTNNIIINDNNKYKYIMCDVKEEHAPLAGLRTVAPEWRIWLQLENNI